MRGVRNPPRICARDGCDAHTVKQRRFCSITCYAVDKRGEVPPCEMCGVPLPQGNKVVCSPACQRALLLKRGATLHSAETIERVRVLRAQQVSVEEVARQCGLSHGQVEGLIARNGIKGPRRNMVATPERDAVLMACIPTYTPIDTILDALNALPGEPMTRKAVRVRSSKLGLSRPADYAGYVSRQWASQQPKAAPVRREPRQRPMQTREKPATVRPIPIPLRELYRWGFQLEVPLSQRGDLAAVSRAARRADPGHPGFRLVNPAPSWNAGA